MKKSSSSKAAKPVTANMTKEEALKTTLAQIEKEYGKGTIMKLGATSNMEVESIPRAF